MSVEKKTPTAMTREILIATLSEQASHKRARYTQGKTANDKQSAHTHTHNRRHTGGQTRARGLRETNEGRKTELVKKRGEVREEDRAVSTINVIENRWKDA